jgi:AcrR family transcriptional regulator
LLHTSHVKGEAVPDGSPTSIPPASEQGSRQSRRKARTRQALVDAAVTLVVDGRADQATIQEITETADVGFGSFYNHFDSKDELFAEALSATLERWGQLLDRSTEEIADPAEVFAARFRLSCRMAQSNPDLARFLTQVGLGALAHPDGLAPRARRDIRSGQEAGRFAAIDPEVALAAVAGGLLGFLARELETPAAARDHADGEITRGVLRLLGLSEADAADVADRPLPELATTS